MEAPSKEIETLFKAIENKEKLVAMLAPSFPIDFSFPDILIKLKKLGFVHFVEVAVGAVETNKQLLTLLKANPASRYITSPCPTMVRLIKNKYPHLARYLSPTDSPMAATAKIILNKFPKSRPVFIGPCIVKKMEAAEDVPGLGIIVLTYKEIQEVFSKFGMTINEKVEKLDFDLTADPTRLYSLSGGLAHSAGLRNFLTSEEVKVVSGIRLIEEALQEFENDTKIRLLDILFCDGGCIDGPGIINKVSLNERRKRIVKYWQEGSKNKYFITTLNS